MQDSEDIIDKFSHHHIACSFIELHKGQALAHQIISWFPQRGLVLSGIYNLYYEYGKAIQGDFLFSKPERHFLCQRF